MSIKSLLRGRAGPRVQIQDVDRVPSGLPVRLRLRLLHLTPDTVSAARILARRHLSLRKAHAALTQVLADGVSLVAVPMVEDMAALTAELASVGVAASRHEVPASVDVKDLRERLGATQEEFALRFGLDINTVQNWEQGRSRPDPGSRAYLSLIRRDPAYVEAMLDAS